MTQNNANVPVRCGLNLLLYTAAFSRDHLDLIPKVAEMGYDGVEIPFTDLDAIDATATRAALEKAGIGATACAVLMPGTNLISGDAAERQAGLDRLKRCVDITADMGGDAVGGPLYAPVGLLTGRGRNGDEWQRGVEGLRAAAEHAERAGIFLAVEPLNRFETYFINTAADAGRLVDDVDHPCFKVQLDTFHSNIEDKNTPSAIHALGKRLGHFHISESDRGTPGTGQVDWPGVFKALKDADYTGWITIESFARGILDLCAAASIWRDIYDSADNLAMQGLQFIKENAILN